MMYNGFVDIQVNGYKCIDFSDSALSIDDVRSVTRSLAANGTIAYCPTICTSSDETYRHNLQVLASAMSDRELAPHILGIHLEGPFISPKPGACGVHRRDCIRKPSVEQFDRMQEWAEGNIKVLTLAPEEPGAFELIRHASANGVTISLGHNMADDGALSRSVEAGARSCTHVGNGLPNEIHRHNNPLWWMLSCDDVFGTFITDGHHLPAAFIKVALRAKTAHKFIVVSDASPLAGMPPGIYTAFGKTVEIEPNGRIACPESGGLAASHSTMFECMNYLASLDIIAECELWKVGRENPLELLGISMERLNSIPGPAVSFDGSTFTVE